MACSYGKDIQTFEQFAQTWSIMPFDEEDGPKPKTYVSFIFRYRTQGTFLRAHSGVADAP